MAQYDDDRNLNSGDDDLEGDDGDRRGGRMGRGRRRRKLCRFCAETETHIDYKNPQLLRYFITDRGKIIPRRITGNCAKHQRAMATAIKRSRTIALMPFTVTGR